MKFYITGLILAMLSVSERPEVKSTSMEITTPQNKTLKLFLCGDVMTGRGIDQALPHPVHPVLYESYVKDARMYLQIAEQKNGRIKTPLSWDYLWGDALNAWEKNMPDLKLINLETSITTHPEFWPGKGIHYRMNPENIKVLTAAGTDYCSLSNNHILDWDRKGLEETLRTLQAADIRFSGAGMNLHEAAKPAVFELQAGRVLIYSYATPGSGVPSAWQAKTDLAGINFLPGTNQEEAKKIKQQIKDVKRPGDIVVFSVHWGGNWGYSIPGDHRTFAHMLLNDAGVDLIYGHSSHHPLGIEVYNCKLILYGAGDFVNDYEGIGGHETYRGELSLMYFPEIDFESGNLISLKMIPMEIKKFRLNSAPEQDAEWLQKTLDRECKKLGTGIRREPDNSLWLEWE